MPAGLWPMICLKNVSKTYGAVTALKAVDLSIPEGMTTGVIGPSGCGKSTLLRLIIGLIYPEAGAVYFKNVKVLPDAVLSLRREMGYVSQEGGLFPHLTAYDNVALMTRYVGWTENKIQTRIEELSELAQLPRDGLNRFPVQLSGGQRQRVSLIRALMFNPDVLLMDEPLGSLDPIIRSELQRDLKTIFQRLRKTVVLVTHDISEAAFLGDILVLLRDGQIIQRGAFEEMIGSPSDPFVTRFINAQWNAHYAFNQNKS
jgi:osmoprotectant transport system ATP-binding protein